MEGKNKKSKNKKEIWAQPKLGLIHLRLKPVLPQPGWAKTILGLGFIRKSLGL